MEIIQGILKFLGKQGGPDMQAAEKAFEEMAHHERLLERERERIRSEQREKKKAHQKRRSKEETVEDINETRRRIHEIQAQEVKVKVEKAIEKTSPAYDQSAYLFQEFQADPALKTQLLDVIERNPKVAELIGELVDNDKRGIHTNEAELLRVGRLLVSDAQGDRAVVDRVVRQINTRVKGIINGQISENRRRAEEQGRQANETPYWLPGRLGNYATDGEKRLLTDRNQWEAAVDQMLSQPLATSSVVPEVMEKAVEPGTLPVDAVKRIDTVWSEVTEAEGRGVKLTVDDLEKIQRKLAGAESSAFPTDVLPGTKGYNLQVQAIHKHAEAYQEELTKMFQERLRTELPPVRTGITNIETFLSEMNRQPGRFGDLLMRNPEMEKLFYSTNEEGYKFRNKVFLHIHSAILSSRRESASENFGLYERADFTSFINFLRQGMKDIKVDKTGKTVGQTWTEWYTSLSTTIRLSRDIDFWASQPGANIENFQKSLSLFQNEYSAQALSMPAVEQAYRAYETSLRVIRDSNDGYIPPSLVEYDAVSNRTFWDDSAQDILTKMMAQGVVKDARRDFIRTGGLPDVDLDGVTVKLGDLLKKPDDLELMMYMTLAKGFGMVSMRFLEMIANSKVPGSGMDGFHSPVYEGASTALNYFNLVIHKWHMGADKYFHMVNAVLPNEQKLGTGYGDAAQAYEAYHNGTFEKKYGKKAKRIIDELNFDRSTGAWGPPVTSWRHMDTTIDWSDKQRSLMGGPTRIQLAKAFAKEKVKQYLVAGKYKEEFRQAKKAAGQPYSGPEFDRLWQSEGIEIYGNKIDNEWEQLEHSKDVHHLLEHYERTFKARVWVETVMKNPLAVSHAATVEVPIVGYKGKSRSMKLHNFLIQEILGIPPEELEYGSVPELDEHGNPTGRYKVMGAKYSTPTIEQQRKLSQVMDLEADIASVREQAIGENRELKESDFNIIGDPVRKKQALKYWEMCRTFMLGSADFHTHEHLYKELGLSFEQGSDFYHVDWKNIEHGHNFSHLRSHAHAVELKTSDGRTVSTGIAKVLDDDWLDRDWGWLFATDDTAFRQMAILNLGSRQWVRRGGDAAAHFMGGQKVAQYFQNVLVPSPDVHDIAKALLEIRQAYEGDDISVGYRMVGNIAYLTSKMYEFDLGRLGSVAQTEVFKTRRNVAAWTANSRRKFWDALEHIDLIPASAHIPHFTADHLINIHELRKLNHADNRDVWFEIILLGAAFAAFLTLYRALSTPSEDEGSGGGGGGGHH